MFNMYPYMNINDLNLDYILKSIKSLKNEVENFVSLNAIKYANPIQWNITSQYEKNTVVIDPVSGVAYLSVKPVPMGVSLSNTEYWTEIFDLGQIIGNINKNLTIHNDGYSITSTYDLKTGDWVLWNGVLYEAMHDIDIGDAYVIDANIEQKSVEELVAKYIAALYVYIGQLTDLNTTDKTSIVNAINEVFDSLNDAITILSGEIGVLDDLTTTDKSNLVAALNEVYSYALASVNIINNRTGWLDDLNTTDKSNLVAAINEVNTYAHNSIDVINIRTGWLTDLNTSDKSNLVAAINEVNTGVNTLNTKINNIFNRHYLLVTDSYGDPAAVAGGRTWLDFFGDIVGAANVTKTYAGGYGFNPSGYTAPFINLITAGAVNTGIPANYDKSKVTDIVVVGGFNDRAQTVSNIKSAINTFVNYAKSNYTNLKNIYIGAVGWSMNAEHLATLSKGRYIKAYSECGDFGAKYLSGLEYVMHGFDLYTADDAPNLQLGKQYVHPNAVGSLRIAQSTFNAITNGYATCHMPWSAFTLTLKDGVTVGGNSTINIAEYQHDGLVCLSMAINTFAGTFNIGNAKTVIPLATIDHGYYNANDFTMIPCTGWVGGVDYAVNTPMEMYLQIMGGELQAVVAGNLENANTKTARYLVINPLNVFVSVLAS